MLVTEELTLTSLCPVGKEEEEGDEGRRRGRSQGSPAPFCLSSTCHSLPSGDSAQLGPSPHVPSPERPVLTLC